MKEFSLIEEIQKTAPTNNQVIHSIGDDAAVFSVSHDKHLVFCTDMLCEGVHFLPEEDPALVGRKALAVNLSDMAAMAAKATHAVCALSLGPDKNEAYAKSLVKGLCELAEDYNVSLCGGDTVMGAPTTTISVSLTGEVDPRSVVLRKGAKVGDPIFVTGHLGNSFASKKHLTFTPRLKEAFEIKKLTPIHAMIDLSDGLATDIRHILKQSRVGALLFPEAIPLSSSLLDLGENEALRRAMTDGEDFELLFTAPTEAVQKLQHSEHVIGCSISQIGEIIQDHKLYWSRLGRKEEIKWKGYEHTQSS